MLSKMSIKKCLKRLFQRILFRRRQFSIYLNRIDMKQTCISTVLKRSLSSVSVHSFCFCDNERIRCMRASTLTSCLPVIYTCKRNSLLNLERMALDCICTYLKSMSLNWIGSRNPIGRVVMSCHYLSVKFYCIFD